MITQVDAQLRRELLDILELENQAEVLGVERRFARAAKRSTAAAERARALAALGENNVFVARSQAQQARMLLRLVQDRVLFPTQPLPATGNDMDTGAAAEKALDALLGAVSIIRHRRAAGTLLRGRCRAAEVALVMAQRDALIAAGALHAEDLPISRAQEVGEDAAVNVGVDALMALAICLRAPVQTLLSESNLDDIALGVCAAYGRETLDLVAVLPSDDVPHPTIAQFAQLLDLVCARSRDTMAGGTRTLTPAVVEQLQLLCEAWASKRRTPALERLFEPGARASLAEGESETVSQLHSVIKERRKRSCAHCGATEPVRGDFQACSRCRRAFYCSREHQRAHWRAGHKAACRDADDSSRAAD